MFEEKAKLVSHVELTLSASIVVWTVTAILDQDWLGLGLPVFILAAILNVASCALAFLCLYKGILTRDVKKLKIWLIFNLVISILGLVAILLGMFFRRTRFDSWRWILPLCRISLQGCCWFHSIQILPGRSRWKNGRRW